MTLYSIFNDCTINKAEKFFEGKDYAFLKNTVGETVVEFLKPVQAKYHDLIKNKDYLNQVLREGADKATHYAYKTLSKVYRKVGLVGRV